MTNIYRSLSVRVLALLQVNLEGDTSRVIITRVLVEYRAEFQKLMVKRTMCSITSSFYLAGSQDLNKSD